MESMHTILENGSPHVAHLCFTAFWPDGKHTKVGACGQPEEILYGLCLLL